MTNPFDSPTNPTTPTPASPSPQQTGPVQPAQPFMAAASAPAADRIYASDVRLTFRTIHDMLSTDATFTLDDSDAQRGVISFHSFDDAQFTLTLTATGPSTTELRLSAANDPNAQRGNEFYAALDRRFVGAAHSATPPVTPTQPAGPTPNSTPGASGMPNDTAPATHAHGRRAARASRADASGKKTSKLAVFAIIVAVLFLLCAFIGIDSWGLLIFFTILPAILSGFSIYVTRKDGKAQGRVLAWVAVGITAVSFIIGSVGVIRASQQQAKLEQELAIKCEAYTWPESDLVKLLPKPESTKGEIDNESSTAFSIHVCDTDKTQFDAYVQSVQANGFTVDYSKSDDSFSAKNEGGYRVYITRHYDDETIMDISIDAPKSTDSSSTGAEGSTGSGDGTTNSDNGSSTDANAGTDQSSSATGVSSDVKAALDSYESLMNEYVDFMTKYQADGQPASMAADYAKILIKYNDAMNKLNAIDENTLTPEENQYYLEVVTRVNQKLATVAQ